ncbi:hypothetical protein G9A89_012612 [Geosiphon pyriformis]|nr:hypothetical protein G9A89_012612 [Geosiphon pyriformis]
MEATNSHQLSLLIETNTRLQKENQQLRLRIELLEKELRKLNPSDKNSLTLVTQSSNSLSTGTISSLNNDSLSLTEYLRYGRQLILSGFGIAGQIKLKSSSFLIVGAGGLGSPVAIYLAASGAGRLGIIDYDIVEISNLHRQIIHNESRTGVSKAQSAKMTVEGLNTSVECIAYDVLLDSSNALSIIEKYDIIIDASDNVATRYLVNDACVIAGKPLISGSALRTEGQLTIYNYRNGPCYRCLYPQPPPLETITNCADGGILGVVTGVIGCLQALEAIKIATNMNGESYSNNLLLFSATSYPAFRSIKLRSRKLDCAICGNDPSVLKLQDYVQFCGSGALDKSIPVNLLEDKERIKPKDYAMIRDQKIPHLLLDVREPIQFEICRLKGSINIPLRNLPCRLDEVNDLLPTKVSPVYVICRLGNDSQHAVSLLRGITGGDVKDVIGGYFQWTKEVDPYFPIY